MNKKTIKNWALITGSSAGIGKAIASIMAQRGYNLFIHGRDLKNLEDTKAELEQAHNIQVRTISSDLSSNEGALKIIETIEQTKDCHIEVLVNNAGFGVAGTFLNTDLNSELEMVSTHVNSTIILTKHFSKLMKLKSKGYILTVSSLYSFFPVPRQAIYGATKAFEHSFSKALHKELKEFNINCTSLCPGLTYSRFRTRQGHTEQKRAIGMSSEEVARLGVDGLFKNKAQVVPGAFNKFTSYIMTRLPIKLSLFAIDKMNSSRGY